MPVLHDQIMDDQSLWTPENQRERIKLTNNALWRNGANIFVFDMDGTIADSTHRHHFLQSNSIDAEGNVVVTPRPEGKDWPSFFAAQKDDTLHLGIAKIMEALISNLNIVIILTARPEGQRRESVRWLHEWSVPHHALFMRPENNRTDDNILKAHQLHTYLGIRVCDVATVFEDRRRIVHSLRSHGFHVCHVAEGDF